MAAVSSVTTVDWSGVGEVMPQFCAGAAGGPPSAPEALRGAALGARGAEYVAGVGTVTLSAPGCGRSE